jgi:hypothetical protein
LASRLVDEQPDYLAVQQKEPEYRGDPIIDGYCLPDQSTEILDLTVSVSRLSTLDNLTPLELFLA